MSAREIKLIKASERVAYGVECAHCSRDSLLMTTAGLITWKAPHGDGDAHANAVTIQTLLTWGVDVLDVATLKGLRQMIDEAVERSA